MGNDAIKTFTNTDSEDFEGMYGGQPIHIKAGETKPFTEKIAKHLAGQLAYKIALRGGAPALTPENQAEIAGKMVGEIELPATPPVPSPEIKAETSKEEEFADIKPKKKAKKK